MPTTVLGVLFDIDDTLIDYSGTSAYAILAHLADQGLSDRVASDADAVALWEAVMEEEFARHLAGATDFREHQRIRVRRFLAEIGALPPGGMSDAAASAWFAGYARHRDNRWSAFPDAAPTLRLLQGRGLRLGLVSNASHGVQQAKLEAVGLSDFFGGRAMICSAEHGVPKPDPSIFHAGCGLLGLDPRRVAYIGDRYETDALGARGAGLLACWLDRGGADHRDAVTPADGVRVIRSLHELPPLLP